MGRWSGEGLGPDRGSGGGHLGPDGGDGDAGLDVEQVKHVLNPTPESRFPNPSETPCSICGITEFVLGLGKYRLEFFESKTTAINLKLGTLV